MSDFISALSPEEKRALLEQLLREEAAQAERFPLSFGQQRLWFLDRLEGGSALYTMAAVLRLRGPVQPAVLRRCQDEIVRRHAVLRTTFALEDGQPVQVIAPALSLPLPVEDLRALPPGERSARARHWILEEQQQPFDLAQGPLLRTRLLRLEEQDYYWLLTVHHSVSDGGSLGILLREIAALYPAFAAGRPSPLPEPPIQYADYAVWQRQWLSGEHLSQLSGYWQRQLAGAPALLELPADHSRAPLQSGRGSLVRHRLDGALTGRLKALSRQSGTTLFMTLLAAFAVLLSRYSGQTDLVIGSPIANRNRPELEPLIGFFVNTLVLRIDLTGNPSFAGLLERVRRVALDAYAHQELPFEKLVEELRLERDLSRNPLFQVMFALQQAPQSEIPVGALTLSLQEQERLTAKFDLSVDVWEDGQGLTSTWEYSLDLFEAATVERMAAHFQTLLEGIACAPQHPISSLPLLSAVERHRLLADWNRTAVDYPETCIQRLFETQVERTPDAVAVAAGAQTLSYRELNRRANRLAWRLREIGVGPDTPVALFAERSPELIAGVLGILKAGGAYLPLDPLYPKERLAFMLRDAGAPVLLTEPKLLPELPATPANILLLEPEPTAAADDANPPPAALPDHLAYVIYTSGSTGQPKGVMVSHRALVNFTCGALAEYGIRPEDRVLQFAALSFDAAAEEIYPCLAAGATLVLRTDEMLRDIPTFLQTCRDWRLTVLDLPTAYWHLLTAELAKTALRLPESLRLVIIGGEQAHLQHLERWHQGGPRPALLNTYGPSEATVAATWADLSRPEPDLREVPIGRPLPNVRAYVLDRCLEPVPPGVAGELYIGGAGLARGYLDNPALTAERFIPAPFGAEPGGRLYRSGDRVRYRSDSRLEFLGRFDQQVKVRGFRIELEEIEAVLAGHPGVREAAVTVREAQAGEGRLIAYAVPQPPQAPDLAELRDYLKARLPHYMLPADVVLLEALPLSPSGKVDHSALPAPAGVAAEDYTAPRTPAEQTLAAIWAELLGLERVGIDDNFFALGGDSILSIQVVARARQAGLKLSSKQVFQHQTIAELAAAAGRTAPERIEPGPVTGSVPLTPIQRWFFERDLPCPRHFNQAVLLETVPALKPEHLEQAVAALLAQHDALRLRFHREGSGWRQELTDREGAEVFSVLNLAGRPAQEQRALIGAEAAALQASLDLTAGPLVRVVRFELGAEQPGRLLIIVHHLAVDGVSWRILLEDLATACRQLDRGQAISLPPKTSSFKQWAEFLEHYARSPSLAAELDGWLVLERTAVAPFPIDIDIDYDHPEGRQANTVESIAQVSVSLSADDTRALLQDLPQVYHTRINDVLLTALVLAYTRWCGEPALLVDLEGHGREELGGELDLSRTVGWFTSLFPVLLAAADAVHPGAVLQAVKERLRGIPNHGIGYGLLRYLAPDPGVRARLQALPRAELGFNYLGQFEGAGGAPWLGPAGEPVGPTHDPREIRDHLVDIDGLVMDGRLRLDWTYSTNLHRRTTIETLARHYLDALQELLAHCRSAPESGYTPSDFPEAGLDELMLERLARQIGDSM